MLLYVCMYTVCMYSYLSPEFSAFLPKSEPVLGGINASFLAGWNQPRAFGFFCQLRIWASFCLRTSVKQSDQSTAVVQLTL